MRWRNREISFVGGLPHKDPRRAHKKAGQSTHEEERREKEANTRIFQKSQLPFTPKVVVPFWQTLT
jgi:hypothetical protein